MKRKRPAARTSNSQEELIISIGEVHGITNGSVFKIQGKHVREGETELPSFLAVVDASLPYLSTVLCTAQEMQTFSGVADHDSSTGSDDTSEQTVVGMASLVCGGVGSELSVAVMTDTSPLSHALVEEIAKREFKTVRLKFVGRDAPHQLLISVREGKVALDVVDGQRQQRIPVQICDVETVFSALEHSAHFFWHLSRTPDSPKPKNLSNLVAVEAWELGAIDGKYTSASSPIGDNLIQDGAIRIPVRQDDKGFKFAFKITNASSFNLYAWVFAFDTLDLNIGMSCPKSSSSLYVHVSVRNDL